MVVTVICMVQLRFRQKIMSATGELPTIKNGAERKIKIFFLPMFASLFLRILDETSFFTDLVTVGSMDFDWLIPFTSNNVKRSIAPISSQRKQANQALHLKRTHLHDNAAENGKKKESYGQHWTYLLNLKWLMSLVMVFYLFTVYLSELCRFNNFTESVELMDFN